MRPLTTYLKGLKTPHLKGHVKVLQLALNRMKEKEDAWRIASHSRWLQGTRTTDTNTSSTRMKNNSDSIYQINKEVKTQCSWMIRSFIDEKKQRPRWTTMDEEDTLRRGRRRTTRRASAAGIVVVVVLPVVVEYCSSILHC
jgi:hypothetical protein